MAQAISKKETTQTAVEWLALRYHHRQGYLSQEDIEQAKQMEKEQLEKALPSNEEINNEVDDFRGWVLIEKDFFKSGAKWMKNKILRYAK